MAEEEHFRCEDPRADWTSQEPLTQVIPRVREYGTTNEKVDLALLVLEKLVIRLLR